MSILDPPVLPRIRAAESALTAGARGLRDPNPGAARLLDLPRPMELPPAVTIGAVGGATAIAGSVLEPIASNNVEAAGGPRFRRFGAMATFANGYCSSVYASRLSSNTVYSSGPWGVEFGLQANQFELVFFAEADCYFRLLRDGAVAVEQTAVNPGGAGDSLVLIDNGDWDHHEWRLIMGPNTKLKGIRRPVTGSLTRPRSVFGPNVIAITDSYGNGWSDTGAATPVLQRTLNSMYVVLGDLLGWRIRVQPVDGTGILRTSSGVTNYRPRVLQELSGARLDGRPWDVVIVHGSVNDGDPSYTALQMTTETGLLLSTILGSADVATDAAVIVTGPANQGAFQSVLAPIRAAITTAAVAAGAINITPMDDPTGAWFNGTGKVGTPASDGNADRLNGPDGVHPSPEGHIYHAWRRAASFGKAIAL